MSNNPSDSEQDFTGKMAEERTDLIARYCAQLAVIPLPPNVASCRIKITLAYDDGCTAAIDLTPPGSELPFLPKRRWWWPWGAPRY